MPSPSPSLSASVNLPPVLLKAEHVTKAFPGVVALDRVNFELRPGEIHSLMGENGAGKSTLIKVLTGVYQRDAGEIWLNEQSISPRSPQEAQQLGISTVYQEVNLVPNLSVAENLFLNRQPKRWGCIQWKKLRSLADAALARLNIKIDVSEPLNSYSIAIQQMVAIARAIDQQAKVLILDEPTSSLDQSEVAQLFSVLRHLKQQGLGIVFVSHFLDQIYEISDRITVLRNGCLIGQYEIDQLPRLQLIEAMIGKKFSGQTQTRAEPLETQSTSSWSLKASQLEKRHYVGPVDFTIHAGETLGFAGLLGSGRTETARLLFGLEQPTEGSISINHRPSRSPTPRQAIAQGLGFCPEDRKHEGICPDLSLRENIVLALQAKRGWLRPLTRKKQQELADHYIQALNIKTSDSEKPIRFLSGGNQQKGIIARWLAAEPSLLILDEPTRGIDVGAKAEIEKLIQKLCGSGMAIVLICSELDEIVRSSHRVLVFRDRKQVAELSGEQLEVNSIMKIIAQHEAN